MIKEEVLMLLLWQTHDHDEGIAAFWKKDRPFSRASENERVGGTGMAYGQDDRNLRSPAAALATAPDARRGWLWRSGC